MLFTKEKLRKLIIPLLIEQLLAILVGMIDTIMISSVGEAAVSGVSLVDTINVLLIGLFSALATGGAVLAGQYLGQGREKEACKAANQLVLVVSAFSLILMAAVLIIKNFILTVVFGHIEPDVMANANIYLIITTLSIPALAVYNACAALFRAMGNAKVTMWVSLGMNLINFVGNAVLIYGFSMGAAGAAAATTFSRFVAVAVIMVMMFKKGRAIHFDKSFEFKFRPEMVKRILFIGIPNGLENSMFQLGKIIVLSLVSTFGTFAIAANAVAGVVATFNVLPGTAIGLAMLSVISMCVGANDYDQARYYTKKLVGLIYACTGVISALIFVTAPLIIRFYNLTAQTGAVTVGLLRYHSVCAFLIWPPAFSIPNTFRAANDVKYSMAVSIFSMWVFRIGFSYLMGRYLGLGVFGVWIAMTIDWLFRGICFVIHYLRGKWTTKFRVI